jgi:hypothetical protein
MLRVADAYLEAWRADGWSQPQLFRQQQIHGRSRCAASVEAAVAHYGEYSDEIVKDFRPLAAECLAQGHTAA